MLFELLSVLNRFADEAKLDTGPRPADVNDFRVGLHVLRSMSKILGLFWEQPAKASLGGDDKLVAGLMQLVIELRNNLRAEAKKLAKDDPTKKMLFAQTDLIRQRLGDVGVTLEDRPAGTTWRVG